MSDIGGQAVIEGVMMRNKGMIATAVRKKNGKIIIKRERLNQKPKFLRLFFIRGIVNLIEMLVLGIKTLMWSADQSAEKKEEKLSSFEIAATLLLSMLLVILFFIALPYFLTNIIGIKEETAPIAFNLVDGLIKIALFLSYIYLISLMKDVKTLFQYHGAEHKAVHCYEHGKELAVENAKQFTTLHPRCGTSFLMIVLIVSIIVFSLLPSFIIYIYPSFNSMKFFVKKLILFASRIIVIPIIAGFSYEILKLSSKFRDNRLMLVFITPGLWLQRLTTREPTKKQIDVAIAALKSVLKP